MQEIDVATIKKRSITGVMSLVSRTFFIQVISQVVTFLLTVYLSPTDYGVFFLVSTVIVFLTYFSDIGLAAALIQKKDEITENDLKTTFTIQQSLVLFMVIIGLALTPVISSLYDLEREGILLYQALIIAFFLSSLKTIPSILLERNLKFQKLVIPEIVETLVFNVLILVLAIKGFGIMSFTYSVIARGLVGVIALYIIAPWKIKIGFNKESASRLLSFGLPFQANSLLALIKDNLFFLYLGAVLPKPALGYIGVAQKWAYIPLRLIMDNLIRITFPSFSRLAGNPEYLAKAIEKTLFSTMVFIFPSLTGMVLLMPHFINIFPKYEKWEPALFALFFFAINAALSSITTPLTNALNAIGKIKITLKLMVFWTGATWILTPVLITIYGFNGVAIASALVSLSVFGVVWLVKKDIPFLLLPQFMPPFIATLAMGIVLYIVADLIVVDFLTLFIAIIISGAIYILTLYLIAAKQIRSDIQLIRDNLKR